MLPKAGKHRWTKRDVNVITGRFKYIRKEHGKLTPALIVADARDPSSPLHKYFEWDDAIAAEKWRLEQAKQLIWDLKINIGTEEAPKHVRAYVSIVDDGEQQYAPITEVRRSPELTAQLLARVKAEMETFILRYQILEEFLETKVLTTHAQQMVDHLTKLLEKMK